MKNGLDKKQFWKTIKPFLSDKNTIFLQISLEKNNKIASDKFDLSEEFTTFFKMLSDRSLLSQMNITKGIQKV